PSAAEGGSRASLIGHAVRMPRPPTWTPDVPEIEWCRGPPGLSGLPFDRESSRTHYGRDCDAGGCEQLHANGVNLIGLAPGWARAAARMAPFPRRLTSVQ